MYKTLVPINKARHASKKVRQAEGFGYAAGFHIASIMAHEFARAASIYPIVFLEDKAENTFRPVVLMGLESGENLFVDTAGKWQASYIPAIIRRSGKATAEGVRLGRSEMGYFLGVAYLEGATVGTPDRESALLWLERSARIGNRTALARLAGMR